MFSFENNQKGCEGDVTQHSCLTGNAAINTLALITFQCIYLYHNAT